MTSTRIHAVWPLLIAAAITVSAAAASQPVKTAPEPARAAPPQRVSAGGKDYGGRVYLCLSAAGWPRTWADYDDPRNVFVDPRKPREGADLRYWLTSQAQLAAKMQVDGIVFTTPHVPPADVEWTNKLGEVEKKKDPDQWRMRFEGRIDALRNHPAMGDAHAIANGLREARRILPPPAEFILYVGYPDDRDRALLNDTDWCDGYVKASLGAYLNVQDVTGAYIVSRVIVDTVGAYVDKPESRAVLASIRRLYPWVKVGGEPQPRKASFIFDTGVTTRAHWKNLQKPTTGNETIWGTLRDELVPAKVMAEQGCAPIIYYTEGPRLDMEDAIMQMTVSPVSIAVFAWTVGEEANGPKQPGDHERWLRFMAKVREMRKKWDPVPGAPVPPPPAPAPEKETGVRIPGKLAPRR